MQLLSTIQSDNDDCEIAHERIDSSVVNKSEQFIMSVGKRDYQRQYFHIYGQRLEALRERVVKAVKEKYGDKVCIKRLSELDEIEDGKNAVVIGTLFKSQIYKPNILNEVGEENALTNEATEDKEEMEKFIDESDELVLEDELQRARLYFDEKTAKGLTVGQFVTGVVCGILGSMVPSEEKKGGGKFKVEEMFFPQSPQKAKPSKSALENNDRYLAFISGLELNGSSSVKCLGALELASSWITGEAGEMSDQEKNSRIERLVIAGNSLSADTRDRNILSTAKYLTTGQTARSVEAVSTFDNVLADLASGLDVDVMPGSNDPANQNLPQQPLHCCLFPKAAVHPTLRTVTNPYMFESCGHTILGTSGQNVADLLKNSSLTDPLEALECLIRWSHLAPTCPDTLGCFPYDKKDPFVLESLPRILFAGNQDKYGERTIKLDDGSEVLLLSIPRFTESNTVVMLNMKTLKTHPMVFDYMSN